MLLKTTRTLWCGGCDEGEVVLRCVDGSGVMTMVVLWSGGGEAVVVEWVVTVAHGDAWEGGSDRSGDGDQFGVRPEKSAVKLFRRWRRRGSGRRGWWPAVGREREEEDEVVCVL
ncbi:hypothetical protein Tco_0108680 [Tanacetum coccineum]